MFVQRMMTDPDFAAKVHAQQAAAAADDPHALGGDPLARSGNVVDPATAQRYLDEHLKGDESAPPPITEDEAKGLEYVEGRTDEVKVIAQSLAFMGVGAGAKRRGGLAVAATPELAGELAALFRTARATGAVRSGRASAGRRRDARGDDPCRRRGAGRRSASSPRRRRALVAAPPPRRAPVLAAAPRRRDPRRYAGEESGPEAFRKGALVDAETVAAMLDDATCDWLTVEAANGRGGELSGNQKGAVAATPHDPCCRRGDNATQKRTG